MHLKLLNQECSPHGCLVNLNTNCQSFLSCACQRLHRKTYIALSSLSQEPSSSVLHLSMVCTTGKRDKHRFSASSIAAHKSDRLSQAFPQAGQAVWPAFEQKPLLHIQVHATRDLPLNGL